MWSPLLYILFIHIPIICDGRRLLPSEKRLCCFIRADNVINLTLHFFLLLDEVTIGNQVL